jgi:hypothetical protein
MIAPGIYADIVPHPAGGFVRATLGSDWRTVTVDRVTPTSHETLWSHLLPSACLYLRVAVSPKGDAIVVGQDGKDHPGPDGALWIIPNGAAVSVDGYGFGQYGAVVEWWEDGDAFIVSGARRHDYGVAFVTRDGEIGPFVNRLFPKAIADQGGTSQGWLDVLDGQFVWTDLARLWPSQHAVQLVCPFTREGVTVGQVPGDGHGLRAYGPGVASQVAAEDVFEARVAYDPASGVYAVCARLLNFRTLLAFCPPWPAIPAAPVVEPPPVVVPPVPVELPRLGVTIDHYTAGGPAPCRLTADYHVEGHGHAPVQVYLTLDGQRVAMETDPAGQLETTVTEPGEYRLGAVVDCAGRRAQTGAVRIVRVTAPVQPPPPVVPPVPPMPPIPTGRDAFTVAAGACFLAALGLAILGQYIRALGAFGVGSAIGSLPYLFASPYFLPAVGGLAVLALVILSVYLFRKPKPTKADDQAPPADQGT